MLSCLRLNDQFHLQIFVVNLRNYHGEKHCPLSIYQDDNMILIKPHLAGAALELYIWQIIRA